MSLSEKGKSSRFSYSLVAKKQRSSSLHFFIAAWRSSDSVDGMLDTHGESGLDGGGDGARSVWIIRPSAGVVTYGAGGACGGVIVEVDDASTSM